MTIQKNFKRIIRQRQKKTGEAYTTARAQVLRERAALSSEHADAPTTAVPVRAEAVVLKVNEQSARVRVHGEKGQMTFRSEDAWQVVPGHLVTLIIDKRWTWRGNDYASGHLENPRIDIDKLDLEPLPLTGGEPEDLRAAYDPYEDPDPYAPLWRKLTAKPRPSYEMTPIAWGVLPGMDDEDNPTCKASELMAAGEDEEARELLMDALCADLRCIDAHAHLGNLEFDLSPERAMLHYEIGIRISELSLPRDFKGVMLWGHIYNRPYLRCLHGYGLCLWRLGWLTEARRVFERILSLNPNDNQGVRFCWEDACNGRSWEEMLKREEAAHAERFQDLN